LDFHFSQDRTAQEWHFDKIVEHVADRIS